MNPREKMLQDQQEQRLANQIIAEGERLGLSWYKWQGKFWQVYSGKIYHASQNDLIINTREGWFILDIANMNAILLYIDGFEKILPGVSKEHVIIYPDKYFSYKIGRLKQDPNLQDNRITELWRYDSAILLANDIVRLDKNLWTYRSNKVWYISDNLTPGRSLVVGHYQPFIHQDGLMYYNDPTLGLTCVQHILQKLLDNPA